MYRSYLRQTSQRFSLGELFARQIHQQLVSCPRVMWPFTKKELQVIHASKLDRKSVQDVLKRLQDEPHTSPQGHVNIPNAFNDFLAILLRSLPAYKIKSSKAQMFPKALLDLIIRFESGKTPKSHDEYRKFATIIQDLDSSDEQIWSAALEYARRLSLISPVDQIDIEPCPAEYRKETCEKLFDLLKTR